jgi:uncharacterized membrane protein
MRKSETDDSLNLFAGVWFSAASCIPVIFTFLVSPNPHFSFTVILLFVLIPISVTFFSGLALGSDILNPNKVKTSKEAMIKGLMVALLSYVIFVLLFALYTGFYQTIFDRNPHEFLTVDFAKNLLFGLVLVGIFGSIVVGWLVLIIGTIAGWLLFKYRLVSARLRDA